MTSAGRRPTGDDATRARTLALAENALDRSRPDEALERVAEVLASTPQDPEAWAIATRAHLAAGNAEEAVEASGRLCALLPDVPVALRLRALALAAARDRAGAIATAERVVQLAPDEAWSHGVLAAVLSDLGGSGKRARHEAAHAVELDPTDASLHTLVAQVALAQRRIRDARAAVGRALDLDPTDGDAIRLAALADGAEASGSRTVRALQRQADQLRVAPGEEANLLTMGLLARTFLSRAAAILALGTVTAARLWMTDREHHLDLVQPVAVLTAVIAASYLVVTLVRVDSAVRGYLGDVLRSRWLLGAAAGSGLALVSLVACAAWQDPATVALLIPAGVGSVAAVLLARRETGTFLRRHGQDLAPWLTEGDLRGLGILLGLFTLAAAALAIGNPDGLSGRDRLPWAVAAVLLGALGALDLMTLRRRRRR